MAGFNPRSVDGSSRKSRQLREMRTQEQEKRHRDESYQDRIFFNRYREKEVLDHPADYFSRELQCAIDNEWFVVKRGGVWVEATVEEAGAQPDMFRAHDFLMTYIDPGPRGFPDD